MGSGARDAGIYRGAFPSESCEGDGGVCSESKVHLILRSYVLWAAADMPGGWESCPASLRVTGRVVSEKLHGKGKQGFFIKSREREEGPGYRLAYGKAPRPKRTELLQGAAGKGIWGPWREAWLCSWKGWPEPIVIVGAWCAATGGLWAWRVRNSGQRAVSAGERHELLFSHKQPQKIVPRPVPSHGYFLFLFFN